MGECALFAIEGQYIYRGDTIVYKNIDDTRCTPSPHRKKRQKQAVRGVVLSSCFGSQSNKRDVKPRDCAPHCVQHLPHESFAPQLVQKVFVSGLTTSVESQSLFAMLQFSLERQLDMYDYRQLAPRCTHRVVVIHTRISHDGRSRSRASA